MNRNIELIKEITSLLSTPFITTLLGFSLGIFGQRILKLRKIYKNKKDFDSFNSMITTEYITPCNELLVKYFSVENPIDISLVQNYIGKSVEQLNYLKRNELYFLKTDNQFKMIRLIEFTNSYFFQLGKSMDFYTFKTPTSTQEEYDEDKDKRKRKVIEIKKKYEKNKQNYLDLKTDKLIK